MAGSTPRRVAWPPPSRRSSLRPSPCTAGCRRRGSSWPPRALLLAAPPRAQLDAAPRVAARLAVAAACAPSRGRAARPGRAAPVAVASPGPAGCRSSLPRARATRQWPSPRPALPAAGHRSRERARHASGRRLARPCPLQVTAPASARAWPVAVASPGRARVRAPAAAPACEPPPPLGCQGKP
nr:atherin-like [Aegilops tauschii subsp. strangulata]